MEPYFSKDGKFLGSISDTNECTHRNAEPTGQTCSEGCCDYYLCKDCGKRFIVECPD
jgi:hypothetical protein